MNYAGPPRARPPPTVSFARARRRRRWLVIGLPFLVTVVVVGSVIAWGLETRSPSTSGTSGGGAPPGPDPNPQHDRIVAVYAKILYTGSQSNYLSITESGNLCGQCPVVVPADYAYSPPVAGFTFFLNLTNPDTAYHTVGNFSVNTTNPSGGSPFKLVFVACCDPAYDEQTDAMGLTPGQTFGVDVFVTAASLQSATEVDYTLQFWATSSS